MGNKKLTISDSFLTNCTLFPNNNAIFIDNEYYTYSQVLACVSSIYSQIIKQNKDFDRIGIYCTDDIQTYASILAISIYGAAFVPLNSTFPVSRNIEIIEAAELYLILNSDDQLFQKELKDRTFLTINNSTNQSLLLELPKRKVIQPLAYILFTSGTTGKPKGVPITHQNAFHFFDFYLDKTNFDFIETDRFIQVFDLTFDVSIFSFFMPLTIGACCYVSPQKGIRFLEIVKMMRDHQITVSTLVPTVLQYIEKYIDQIDFPKMKYSFFIGDKLSHSIVSNWATKIVNAEIVNFYGPTEATIMCSYYKWQLTNSLNESNNDVVPIGIPFPNVEAIIINNSNEIISNLEIGELCLAGNQVVDSYLNNAYPDRFISLKNEKGKLNKYYKTGDLVSLNSTGNLLFHTRKDNQVKINGHRIEIIEIEQNIRKLTNDIFHLICIKDKKQVNQLVLFVEKNELKIDFTTQLKSLIPDYMIPKKVIILDSIPFNSNSKVDQKRLEEIFHTEY